MHFSHTSKVIALALSLLPLAAFASTSTQNDKPKSIVFVRQLKDAELFDQLIYPAKVISQVNTVILSETDGIVTKILSPLGQSVIGHQNLMVISHIDPIYQYAPMTILAPVSGVVSSVEVTEGTQVSKGQRLATVMDPKKIRVTLEIPAQDLALIFKGMSGEFKPMGSEQIISVKVRGVSPFVDPATGTASCEVELSSPGKKKVLVSPGLLGQVSFKANQHSGISIPDTALFYKGSETFVRVIEGEKAKHLPVVLGKKQRGYVEILKGLPPNSVLVERSSRYIGDGESVTVEKAPEKVAD